MNLSNCNIKYYYYYNYEEFSKVSSQNFKISIFYNDNLPIGKILTVDTKLIIVVTSPIIIGINGNTAIYGFAPTSIYERKDDIKWDGNNIEYKFFAGNQVLESKSVKVNIPNAIVTFNIIFDGFSKTKIFFYPFG